LCVQIHRPFNTLFNLKIRVTVHQQQQGVTYNALYMIHMTQVTGNDCIFVLKKAQNERLLEHIFHSFTLPMNTELRESANMGVKNNIYKG